MSKHGELWHYIDRLLEGRSWRWLADQLPDGASANTVSNWADGKHPLKEYRADQLAAVLGVHPNEIRSRAGLPMKEERDAAQPTTTNAAGDVVPASRYDRSGRDLVAEAYEQMRLIVEAGQVVLSDLERLLDDKDDPATRERNRSDDPLSDPRA